MNKKVREHKLGDLPVEESEITEMFEKIDDMIILHRDRYDQRDGVPLLWWNFKEKLDKLENAANKNVGETYPRLTWYKNLKKQSPILGGLMANRNYLKKIHVTIDQVIKIICSLMNYSPCHNKYVKMPDRYCVRRSETSRIKLKEVYYLLNRILPEVFFLRFDFGELFIRINIKQLQDDEYLSIKAKKFAPKDRYILYELRNKMKTIYFAPYADSTFRKKLREVIIGMTLAYNRLFEATIETDQEKEDHAEYGKRWDVTYVEVPVHLIAKACNLSIGRVMSYLNVLDKNTNYIKRHDRVYTRNGIIPQYYNEEYKEECKLTNYRYQPQSDIDKGKRIVTRFSYIIFPTELNMTRVGREVNKNSSYYEHLVLTMLSYYMADRKEFEKSKISKDIRYIDNETICEVSNANGYYISDMSLTNNMSMDEYLNYKREKKQNQSNWCVDEEQEKDISRKSLDEYYDQQKLMIKTIKNCKKYGSYNNRDAKRIYKDDLYIKDENGNIIRKKGILNWLKTYKDLLEYISNEEFPVKDYNYYLKFEEKLRNSIVYRIKKYISKGTDKWNLIKEFLLTNNLFSRFEEAFEY